MKEPTMISKVRCGRCVKFMAGMGVLLFALVLVASHAQAFVIKTGNSDFDVRFDNTVTYSTQYRLKDQDAVLISNPNTDDGDRNFDKGLVMNRFDLLSEMDAVYKKFGVRLSAAAWYDFVYNTTNDNDSPTTVNHLSVPNDEFYKKTRDLNGRYAELLEAFTFGAVPVGDMTFRYRAGQFAQWWGDAFFFGDNGIAAALAPVDLQKVGSLPNAQGKEMIRPIPQISGDLQVTDELSIGAYYQFKFVESRWFGSGSYFAFVDLPGTANPEFLIAGPDNSTVFYRGKDMDARDDGQYGLKAKYMSPWGFDLGLYAMQYHFRSEVGENVVVNPVAGEYFLYFPEDIQMYGASANTAFGIYTVAAEVAYRKNGVFLTQDGLAYIPGAMDEPIITRGDSLHYNINLFMPGLPSNWFSDSADLIFEWGGNTRLKITDYEEYFDSRGEKTAWEAKMVYTPKWYQVLPGLDLTMPMGFTYVNSLSSVAGTFFPYLEGGDYNIGVGGVYENLWEFELLFRNFYGDPGDPEYGNPWLDRTYLSFYIRRAF